MFGECRRSHEAGWSIMGAVVVTGVVTIALGQMVVTSTHGVLAAKRSRDELTVRLAASEVLNRTPPTTVGGAVAPSAPVAGWFDVVAADPKTGALVDATGKSTPGGTKILRQWRLSTEPSGPVVLSVSAALVDDERRPVDGPDGAAILLSRSVRRP